MRSAAGPRISPSPRMRAPPPPPSMSSTGRRRSTGTRGVFRVKPGPVEAALDRAENRPARVASRQHRSPNFSAAARRRRAARLIRISCDIIGVLSAASRPLRRRSDDVLSCNPGSPARFTGRATSAMWSDPIPTYTGRSGLDHRPRANARDSGGKQTIQIFDTAQIIAR